MNDSPQITIPADDVFNHLPLDHLIGISLMIVVIVGMVLFFAWKVVKEVIDRK